MVSMTCSGVVFYQIKVIKVIIKVLSKSPLKQLLLRSVVLFFLSTSFLYPVTNSGNVAIGDNKTESALALGTTLSFCLFVVPPHHYRVNHFSTTGQTSLTLCKSTN